MTARVLSTRYSAGASALVRLPISPEELSHFVVQHDQSIYPHNQWLGVWVETGVPAPPSPLASRCWSFGGYAARRYAPAVRLCHARVRPGDLVGQFRGEDRFLVGRPGRRRIPSDTDAQQSRPESPAMLSHLPNAYEPSGGRPAATLLLFLALAAWPHHSGTLPSSTCGLGRGLPILTV
jgi:hypothetical protein